MIEFRYLKKLACLPLIMILLTGCSNENEGEKFYYLKDVAFTSDTTALLVYECLTDIVIFENGSSHTYCPKNITKLVDVRFSKVYWEAEVEYGLAIRQWNDSTLFLSGNGGYWLWTINIKNSLKPQKININGNIDELYRWRPWKNDSILGVDYYKYMSNKYVIIDSKTMTVNKWAKTGEYEWTRNCNDIYWGKKGGMCLTGNQLYYHPLIGVPDEAFSWDSKMSMFKYDDEGNIAQEPLFLVEKKAYEKEGTYTTYTVEFKDESGNVTEY